MLNLLVWFILWGLSFLVSDVLGLINGQGNAFALIYIGWWIICSIILFISSFKQDSFEKIYSNNAKVARKIILAELFGLFITWIISLIFRLDFFIVYQVVTFIFSI